jgi:hypothetical protein
VGALGRASASSLSRAAAGPAQAGSRADQTAGRAGCVKQPASQPGLFGPATDNTGTSKGIEDQNTKLRSADKDSLLLMQLPCTVFMPSFIVFLFSIFVVIFNVVFELSLWLKCG